MAMRFAAGRSRQYLGSTLINRIYLGATLVYGIIASALNTAALEVADANTPASTAYAEFNADGSVNLVGNGGGIPASPRWWTDNSVPPTWMEYSSTGNGGIVGGLVAGTRYQINTMRTLGIEKPGTGVAARTFTISFYNAATGGTLLGTKTLITNVETF